MYFNEVNHIINIRVNYGVVLTFESVAEILWSDHSNEILVVLHATICLFVVLFLFFNILQNEIWEFFFLILMFDTLWSL